MRNNQVARHIDGHARERDAMEEVDVADIDREERIVTLDAL